MGNVHALPDELGELLDDGQAADVAEHEHMLSETERIRRLALAGIALGIVWGLFVGHRFGVQTGRERASESQRYYRLADRLAEVEGRQMQHEHELRGCRHCAG